MNRSRVFAVIACFAVLLAFCIDNGSVVRAQGKAGGGNAGGGGGNAGGNAGGGVPLLGGSTGPRRPVPNDDYFEAFVPFYTGDYRAALQAFQSAAKGGIRSADGRWIDSICFHTMIGECFYNMGDLTQALDHYNSALKIFLAYPDWMVRVNFPPGLDAQTGASKNPVTWGATTRRVTLGRFEKTYLALQGRLDNQAVLQQGGVMANAQLYPLHVTEIVRCTILALRRRAELLGPVCQHDPMTPLLVSTCGRKMTTPGHWSESWFDLLSGMAQLGSGKVAQATSDLERGMLIAGQFEHPFSCAALYELGRVALHNGQFDMALNFFMESTYSAAAYNQWDVLEEAFRGALVAHLASGRREGFTPLVAGAAWATRVSIPLRASLLVLVAENLSHLGQGPQAMAVLDDARRELGRHDMADGAVGARFQYELAKVCFQTGNMAGGTKALATAMAFQKGGGSRRILQTILADALAVSGAVTDRSADLLYRETLREPTAQDWALQPMESIATMITPQLGPLEHWFELSIARNEPERAAEIADQVKRHRFFSTLPLGGRMLALRWILAAPRELLTEQALLQRQDLLAKYPALAQVARQSSVIRDEIARRPPLPESDDEAKSLAERYEALQKLSISEELALHEIALRRDASDLVFPPPLQMKELRKRLAKDQVVLAFFNTSKYLCAFLIGNERFEQWQVDKPPKIRADIAELLKQWGLTDRNKPVEIKDLQGTDWAANRIMPQLMKNLKSPDWSHVREMILVPDGALWYCPFEALALGDDESKQPLIQRFRLRYVPTIGLAVGDPRFAKRDTKTAIVTGRMYPKDDLQLTRDASETIATALPGVVRLPSKLPGPSSLIGKFFDRFVVLHDFDDADKMPYDWSLGQVDKGKPGSALSSWFVLPWGGPAQVVLPGFHTPAEASLKKGGSGDEIFLALCGMMSTGTRTVLLSRWRVAGQSTFDLVKEFVQELPHLPATEAWQRSVDLLSNADLAVDREPRLRSPDGSSLKAQHPFFWAGYMLVDTGVDPRLAKDPNLDKAAAAIEKPNEKPNEKPDAKPEKKPNEKKDLPGNENAADKPREEAAAPGNKLAPKPEADPNPAVPNDPETAPADGNDAGKPPAADKKPKAATPKRAGS